MLDIFSIRQTETHALRILNVSNKTHKTQAAPKCMLIIKLLPAQTERERRRSRGSEKVMNYDWQRTAQSKVLWSTLS